VKYYKIRELMQEDRRVLCTVLDLFLVLILVIDLFETCFVL
jgi:hypothetical protein